MRNKNYLKTIALFIAVLIVMLPVSIAEELNLVYDANGNLVSGDGFIREYDGFNQLVRVKNDSGNILEEFVWHPIEERILIKKIYNSSGDVAQRIVYINENTVKIKNSSGTFYEHYIYQNGQLVAQRATDGNKQFLHPDHLGSTNLITDINGNVVEETFYSPFGEVISGGKNSRFDYEGKEFDSITQDTDFHFRKYKPEWGRFTQPDTVLSNRFDPQMLNRYSFERNNPYGKTDPTGHIPSKDNAGTIGDVIAIIKEVEQDPENADKTAEQILSIISDEFYKYDSKQGYPNFVYTEDLGVVDMNHFFKNAEWQVKGRGWFAEKIERGWERLQCLAGTQHSCFTYEDLPSNRRGREFGKTLNNVDPLSEQVSNYFRDAHAGTFPNWLWNMMPYDEKGYRPSEYERNYDGRGKALPYVSMVTGGRKIGIGSGGNVVFNIPSTATYSPGFGSQLGSGQMKGGKRR